MPTFTALTTLTGKKAAEGLGEAIERLDPEPIVWAHFEVETGRACGSRWLFHRYSR